MIRKSQGAIISAFLATASISLALADKSGDMAINHTNTHLLETITAAEQHTGSKATKGELAHNKNAYDVGVVNG